jgi:hypothetical protein
MKTKVTESSGNVFKDVGCPHPKERLLKGNIILLEKRLKGLQVRLKAEHWKQVVWFFAGGTVSLLVIMILRNF